MLILLASAVFLYLSFQPRARFGDPATQIMKVPGGHHWFDCYHDRIYLGNSKSDVLFFGSSRTRRAIDADLVRNAYESVVGETLDVYAFHTPWSNPEIMYFFFRDYLANNQAPKMAFFELTPVAKLPRPIRYTHPYFADAAPLYLYLDVLNSWDFVRHKVFAISDFLHLLIRHIDQNLSRLMVAEFQYLVPKGNNCPKQVNPIPSTATVAHNDSFEQLLDAALSRTAPDIASNRIGTPESLLETYEGNANMTEVTKLAIKKFGNSENSPVQGHFWRRGAPASRSLDYYQRIVALGKAHNVKIAFYFLPDLLSPKPPSAQVKEMAKALDAPLYLLPFQSVKVSYHHYIDPTHVSDEFTPVYSVWFASLINKVKEG